MYARALIYPHLHLPGILRCCTHQYRRGRDFQGLSYLDRCTVGLSVRRRIATKTFLRERRIDGCSRAQPAPGRGEHWTGAVGQLWLVLFGRLLLAVLSEAKSWRVQLVSRRRAAQEKAPRTPAVSPTWSPRMEDRPPDITGRRGGFCPRKMERGPAQTPSSP